MSDEVRQELQQLDQAINEKLGSYAIEKDDDVNDYFDLQVIEENLEDDGGITPKFYPMEEGIDDF